MISIDRLFWFWCFYSCCHANLAFVKFLPWKCYEKSPQYFFLYFYLHLTNDFWIFTRRNEKLDIFQIISHFVKSMCTKIVDVAFCENLFFTKTLLKVFVFLKQTVNVLKFLKILAYFGPNLSPKYLMWQALEVLLRTILLLAPNCFKIIFAFKYALFLCLQFFSSFYKRNHY